MKDRSLLSLILQIASWVFSLIVLVPLVLILLNSLKPSADAAFFALSLPDEFRWENYVNAFVKGHVLRGYFNSFIMSSISAVLGVVCAALASFVLVRSVNITNKILYSYFFFGVVATSNMVTTTIVMSKLKLMNSLTGTTILLATQGISFAMLLFTGFIKGLPKELDEAAVVDGARAETLFFKVIFPLLKPVTATGVVLNFLGAWNGFETQLYVLTDSKKWGAILSMYGVYGEFSSPWSKDWGLISAYIVLSIIPVLIVYLIGQKYIIEGMTAGAVKG